jgi:hypothetical protein
MSLDAWTLGFALFALALAFAAWQARREDHERRRGAPRRGALSQ